MLAGWLALLTGCGTLDKTGPYGGDTVLYGADLSITTSEQVIHGFVLWEFQNRAALAKWPEITKAADVMRQKAPQWDKTARALRSAYKANPSDANKAALQLVLAEMQTAMTEASGYMVKAATTTPTK